jgi:ATP-dependent helicase/nuclease subunit A
MITSLPALTIVPAGAGSGKTHYIQDTLTSLIRDNGLAPEKIVAVTYTEAAASELRGRIRAGLVNAGLLDKALLLDQAYISTIHGFGLRLITEFAFDAAASPSPRLLNEDEQGLLSGRALAHSSAANRLMSKLDHYGYRGSFGAKSTSTEDSFRDRMLGFMATLRSIGKDSGADSFRSGVEQQIKELYGETRLAGHLKDTLLEKIQALIKNFPGNISAQCDVSEKIQQELKNNFTDLKRASESTPLDSDWKLWKRLGGLKTYKRGSKLPPGYDDMANEVIAAAQALPLHPGPLADALEHATLLLQAASESLDSYRREKQERGLMDFTDMLANAHQMLVSSPGVMVALREKVDCLVVDEFQDTNPLQFSLLWSLTRQGVPTIIVGDLKQAIMGFQNADSRLLQSLCSQYSGETSPLTGNWRSAKPLMEWINAMGTGLFGNNYTVLTPKAPFTSKLSPLEVIEIPTSVKLDVLASHVTARIHALLQDKTQEVFDRTLISYRHIKGGDIAIICPTRSRMACYATRLRAAGIPCRLQEEGWSVSPVVRLACYALSYTVDTDDLHAALYLAVTELGSHTLESALTDLVEGKRLTDPATLDKLLPLTEKMADRNPSEVLAGIINALDIYGVVALWPDAEQARANLLRLQEECLEFEQANREALACGGYYGSSVKSFLAWLQGKIERDDKQPNPSVLDEEAVQLTTWHSSKGKEWPIVIVCGMDDDYAPRLPTTRVLYEDFSDLGAILDKVKIEIFPDFDATETKDKFLGELKKDTEDSAARLLYVALTRAREKVIVEWPCHHNGKDRKNNSYWQLFIQKTDADLVETTMTISGNSFACRVNTADKEAWDLESPDVKRQLTSIGRRAIVTEELPLELTPEHRTPSSLHGDQSQLPPCRNVTYSKPLVVMQELSAIERGTLVHRCFEVLLQHPELSDQLTTIMVISSVNECNAITTTVDAFKRYLQEKLAPISLRCEEPFIRIDEAGTVITGTIDLLVETKDGFWIVDHKSDRIEEADLEERAAWYYPQLHAYREALLSMYPDKTVNGIIINWTGLGVLTVFGEAV